MCKQCNDPNHVESPEDRARRLDGELEEALEFMGVTRHDWELAKSKTPRGRAAMALNFGDKKK